mgnify:CR=1 FL=1|jgi:uncharacterized membrane protein
MSSFQRKVLYSVLLEICGILVAGLTLLLMSSADASHTFSLSALAATVAMLWSFAFNTLFETWENRQIKRGRSWARRATHAILFEAGLVAVLLPLTAWWLSVSILRALMLEGVLVAVFIAYTYVFTWAFDRLFGLPQSAR